MISFFTLENNGTNGIFSEITWLAALDVTICDINLACSSLVN